MKPPRRKPRGIKPTFLAQVNSKQTELLSRAQDKEAWHRLTQNKINC